jgi:hypothetical protein
MPCVRFEPTIPASERAKTVHALDRSASVAYNLGIHILKCAVGPASLLSFSQHTCEFVSLFVTHVSQVLSPLPLLMSERKQYIP